MSPRWIRRIVLVLFLAGVAGMIAGSIKDNNGVAVTFGLIDAVAALGLILITAVAPPGALTRSGEAVVDESTALDVEHRIRELIDSGADEQDVRRLVARAVDLGRGERSENAHRTPS